MSGISIPPVVDSISSAEEASGVLVLIPICPYVDIGKDNNRRMDFSFNLFVILKVNDVLIVNL